MLQRLNFQNCLLIPVRSHISNNNFNFLHLIFMPGEVGLIKFNQGSIQSPNHWITECFGIKPPFTTQRIFMKIKIIYLIIFPHGICCAIQSQ